VPVEPLVHAAGEIADGHAVDWPSMTATLNSDYERAVAEELELVSRIAEGHRQLHQLLPEPSDTVNEPTLDRARWGHLDLLNIVGRGSYGTVYRAWDTRLERLVALKLFHRVPHPEAVMQEGRMLARIRHENVVTVYGADVVDDVAGIWMELIHGPTLDQIVKEQGPMLPREAAAIGQDVARALGAIHGAQLLHCDVKAQNVVREEGGRVVLMDLGAGRAAPEACDDNQSTDVAGTPRYMAPELLHNNASATRSSDIYSLGVLLFYLVTGKFPVDGRSLGELKQAHLTGQMNALADARRNLPAAYVDVVTRALSHDPAVRPATVGDVQRAMVAVLHPPATDRRPWTWVAAAAAATMAVAAALFSARTPATPVVRSIAVLPIKNLTGDNSRGYVADGLTDVLISNLARIRSVRVPSFAAVAPLRDSEATPAQISERLGVELLLAGSLTQVDTRFRMTVQLIDAAGTAVWGEEIIKEAGGAMMAQADIARLVAERLALTLSEGEQTSLKGQPIDPKAQDAYLRGLALANSGPASALESARLFRQAVEIEPGFAAAFAALSLAENRLASHAADSSPERAAVIRELAERAVALDPQLALGHTALASEQMYFEWNFPEAERHFRRALEVGPGDAAARQPFAMLLAALGRLDEAIALARESQSLEPTLATRAQSVGILYYYKRDYDRATAEFQHALKLQPGFPVGHFGLGRVYSAQGRHAEAIAEITRSLGASRPIGYLVELARVHAAAGQPDRVREVLAEVAEQERQGDRNNLDNLAYIAAAEGRIDEALQILEQARQQRTPNMLWIAVDPRVDPLRSDPRFERLLKDMKLEP
jgi:serine/threonine-protein kinase